MIRVPSSDGVQVAVHEYGGPAEAEPLLLSHATGFHAHCYEPVAARLAERFSVYALDHRGHGQTAAPAGWQVDWSRFGDDALAVAAAIAPEGGLVGVGHSMGGAALLMAASRRPELFRRLVVFEPIAMPDDLPVLDMAEHPIVTGARRRRRVFESFDDAFDNYRDKPPLSVMTPEVLRAYVEHGFRPVDPHDPAAGVELICASEIEAGIFVNRATQRRVGVAACGSHPHHRGVGSCRRAPAVGPLRGHRRASPSRSLRPARSPVAPRTVQPPAGVRRSGDGRGRPERLRHVLTAAASRGSMARTS